MLAASATSRLCLGGATAALARLLPNPDSRVLAASISLALAECEFSCVVLVHARVVPGTSSVARRGLIASARLVDRWACGKQRRARPACADFRAGSARSGQQHTQLRCRLC